MRTNKIIFGFTVAIAALLSSCNQDNEGAIYNYDGATQGLTFSSSTLQSVEVPASQPSFTVELFRGRTADATSGNLEVTRVLKDSNGKDSLAAISGLTASPYSFAPGESMTSVTIDITPLEVGDLATINIAVPKDEASIGAYASTRVKAVKAYEWETIGKGTYTDYWVSSTEEHPEGFTANVDVMKAKGFDRFRIMNPYKDYLASDMGVANWEGWIAPSSASYVEFYTENDVIYYDDFFTGLYYQGDKTAPIYVCHPIGWGDKFDPSHNKWLDEKTLQFAPYYYIDGLGGWNYTQYDEVIVITIP